MKGEINLSEDTPEESAPSTFWWWLAAGIALGLAAGVVFVGPAVTETEPLPEEPEVSPEPSQDSAGISEVVSGFPDALVAVVAGEGRTLSHLIWPLQGAQILRALPLGGQGDARFDPSGRWLAVTTVVPEDQGALLSFGRAPNVTPVVSGVTAMAWHDTAPATLAYTRRVGDQGQLWVVGSDRRPSLISEGLDLGRVAFWGYWGYVLQDEGEVVFLSLEGDRTASARGRALASHPSGWVLVTDGEGLKLVSPRGEVERVRISTDLGEPLSAALSPDFTRVAIVGSRKAIVAGLDGDPSQEVVITPDLLAPPTQAVWSSDSRFVMVPLGLGVWVYDREEEVSPRRILESYSVTAVGVIPPDAP